MNINPTQITNHERTDAELESFWFFCIIVAGKNSDYAARVIGKLLNKTEKPFEFFRGLGEIGIRNALVAAKTGQYDRISKAISQSLDLDLRTCSFHDLKSLFGIGPKTANFFLLHSRDDYEGVVLDTHILRYLRERGIETPKSTPQDQKVYDNLSNLFKSISKAEYPHLNLADRDLIIWTKYSGR
jgi:thermostable 8-oxoguanine DNA glycosylase